VKFNSEVVAVPGHYTSQKFSNCGAIVEKSLSTPTHKCNCGCELQTDVNAAVNVLNLAKNRGGHINTTGVEASTFLSPRPVEQVLTVNVESPSLKARGVSISALTNITVMGNAHHR
jgi:putative transposase